MSQVIPSHVLRVGQTICLSTKNGDSALERGCHPVLCSGCLSMSTASCCYPKGTWPGQPVKGLAQSNGQILTHGEMHCGADSTSYTKSNFNMTCGHQENRHPISVSENNTIIGQPHTRTQSVDNPEELLMSPTLDISIDNLNQLILELDPSFQPFPIKGSDTQGFSYSSKSERNYNGMAPTRGMSQPSQRSASTSTAPTSVSPQNITPVPHVARSDNCTTNGSVTFSGTPRSDMSSTLRYPHSCYPIHTGGSTTIASSASEGLPIPQCGSRDRGLNDCSSYLASSPGAENMLKRLHVHRAPQRISGTSLLSTSPGSDTSYMLGSTHSLLSDDADNHLQVNILARSPSASTGSFSNLNSPYIFSPDVQKMYFGDQSSETFSSPEDAESLDSVSLVSGKSHSSLSPPYGKPQTICPSSIPSSMRDIPVLLVNGDLQHGETTPQASRNNSAFAEERTSSTRNGSSCIRHPSMTSSPSSNISSSLDGHSWDGQPTMKFVMDTSRYWFKPSISREQAIEMLKNEEPGSFVIRDSTSHRGAFGLALKVDASPTGTSPGSQADGDNSDLVRHYLVESSAKGVRIKGDSDDLYFGSLSALVYQCAISAVSLPCKLRIPKKDFVADGKNSPTSSTLSTTSSQPQKSTACNVLYLNSVRMETLTGHHAVQKAVSTTFEMDPLPTPTIVHFKAGDQGITLTDVQRKLFFRRHYPASTISFCGMDPENRKWQKGCRSVRIFGFVAKSRTDPRENVCHVFAEYDVVQPASPVISFVGSLLKDMGK